LARSCPLREAGTEKAHWGGKGRIKQRGKRKEGTGCLPLLNCGLEGNEEAIAKEKTKGYGLVAERKKESGER